MIKTIYSINAKPFLGEENRYHYLYKITNLTNGKVYIGIHSTTNLEDGYAGSGTLLKSAKTKYGLDHFQKEILSFYNTRKELAQAEHKAVNEEFINDENTYNVVAGGNCTEDWSYKRQLDRQSESAKIRAKEIWSRDGYHDKMMEKFRSEEHRKKQSEIANEKWKDPEHREKYYNAMNSKEYKENASKRAKEMWEDPEYRKKVSESNKKTWADPEKRQQMREINLGRYVSPETRKKISEAGKGRICTPETRRKLSESGKGKQAGDKNSMAKPLYKIDKDINIVEEFGSRKSAMGTVNFPLSQIIKALSKFTVAPDGYYYVYKCDYDSFFNSKNYS